MSSYIPLHDRPPYYASLPTPPRSNKPPSPKYAEPDLDPSEPYPWTRDGVAMSDQGDTYGYGEDRNGNGNGNGPQHADDYAGPSRKRQRDEDGHGRASYQPRQSQPPQTQQQPPQVTPIAPSLFGIDARNDFTRTIGDFIINTCKGLQSVEIEIKLGTLTAPLNGTGEPPRRIRMPCLNELIMPPDYPLGPFISSMTKPQNISLNKLLNDVTASSQRSFFPIQFFRAQQTDSFHYTGSKSAGKVRVSRDRKTGEIIPGGIIRKRRVRDLNVYCPKDALDWRISVSTEEPCEMPDTPAEMERDKDRACYRHQLVQVDLTVVKSKPTDGAASSVSYEVEIEILDVPALLAEAEKEASGMENRFDEMLLSCLDTARMLIRNM